jgi:hypothetical protein
MMNVQSNNNKKVSKNLVSSPFDEILTQPTN